MHDDSKTIWSTTPGEREEVAQIGRAMSKMRRMVGRRIIGRMAVRLVASDLELSHLDVIEAVRHCEQAGEATVGAVAEAMRVDPSRGSRLVADLVKKDVLRRVASQDDARRSVVELTDRGQSLIAAMQAVKTGLIRDIVGDWPEEDIARFAAMFERFVDELQTRTRLPEIDGRGERRD